MYKEKLKLGKAKNMINLCDICINIKIIHLTLSPRTLAGLDFFLEQAKI